jgi:hypothetical protein
MLETPGRVEPCFFEEHIPASLADLSVEIQREAANLGQGLHPNSAAELADLVKVMNCYYSNLIEGHNTRSRDIERALSGAELEAETRPLALEARADDEDEGRAKPLANVVARLERKYKLLVGARNEGSDHRRGRSG